MTTLVCDNCGSEDYYSDDAHDGEPFCTNCNSYTVIVEEGERAVDEEE